MILDPDRQAELDQAILETLLRESFVVDPKEEQRLANLLQSLESGTRNDPTVVHSSKTASSKRRSNRWVSLALAMSILLVAGLTFFYFAGDNAAYAAVMRSLEATPVTRTYRMRMVHQRPLWGNREVTADLYLNDQDQFAVLHPGWSRFGDVWIGGDATSRWVAPRLGPAFVGGEEIVGGWLAKKDIPSPYLHVSTVLKRMSRVYYLTMNDNTTLAIADSGKSVVCQHVVGELRVANKMLPSKIELWANLDSGMAQRLELTWKRAASERGPLQWTIDLVDSPELPGNWFTLEGHIAAGRRVIPIKSAAELNDLEKDIQE